MKYAIVPTPAPKRAKPSANLSSLPAELLLEIASYLPIKAHFSLLLTTRQLYSLLYPLFLSLERSRTSHNRLTFSIIRKPTSTLLELQDAVEKYRVDPTLRSQYCDVTALHCATFAQKLDVVQWLLERGAHVDERDDYGWTPLHVAASEGWTEGVEVLLQMGAEVNAVGGDKVSRKGLRWGISKPIPGRQNGGACFQWPRWPEEV